MSKFEKVWVISSKAAALPELCAGAKQLGESSALLYVGEKEQAAGCSKVYYLGSGRFADYIDTMIELVKAEKPTLIIMGSSKDDRLAAGRIAAAVGAGIVSDVSELTNAEGKLQTKRMVYGGAAFQTAEALTETFVACLSSGVFEAAELEAAAGVVDVDYVQPAADIKCLAVKEKAGVKADLKSAKKVVGVGRGVSSEEDLAMVQQLCDAIGADIGCTRPIAEESCWLPRERYIGVSGIMLKPELYISLGISGQVQHTVGISDSGTIVVVNKDKDAPMFQYADYGIVGDLKKVVPMLIEKLK